MTKAILFDLDGTLLPMNQDLFIKEYLKLWASRIGHMVDPAKFARQLLASTEAMIKNEDASLTNQEVFTSDFFPKLGIAVEELQHIIDDFYESDFLKLSRLVESSTAAHDAVTAAIDKGFDIVVATNPVFPLAAIKRRLEWAGLDKVPFKLITSYETCHYCKPNRNYYLEIADLIEHAPSNCLMVGNDVVEDLAASAAGMKTFLVTDCLINVHNIEPKSDYQGTMKELAFFIRQL